jgi:hypothetical protein
MPSAVGLVTVLSEGEIMVQFPAGAKRPDRLWGPPSLLLNGYQPVFHCDDADNLPPSSVEVKNEWSYNCLPSLTFMAYKGKTLPLLYRISTNK